MAIKEVTLATFDKEVLETEQLVIVDFWAAWCTPCRMLMPILEEITQSNSHIKLVKVNVDEEPDLAERYNIMSMPTLLFFRNGKVIEESIGLVSKEQLMNFIIEL